MASLRVIEDYNKEQMLRGQPLFQEFFDYEVTIDGIIITKFKKKHYSEVRNLRLPRGVVSIGGFSGVTSIDSIYLPDTCTEIQDNAFNCCTISKINLKNVIKFGSGAFSACVLMDIRQLPKVINLPSSCFQNAKCLENLHEVHAEYIGRNCFSKTNLQECTVVGAKHVDIYAFLGSDIECLKFIDCESVDSRAFVQCTNLKEVYIENCDFDINLYNSIVSKGLDSLQKLVINGSDIKKSNNFTN